MSAAIDVRLMNPTWTARTVHGDNGLRTMLAYRRSKLCGASQFRRHLSRAQTLGPGRVHH